MSSERLLYLVVLSYTFFASMLSSSQLTKLTARDKSSEDRSIDALFAKSRSAVATSFSKTRRFLQESLERT